MPATMPRPDQTPSSFLAGGGAIGARTRAFDWIATPLGQPATWPPALQTLVELMFSAQQPMFIAWGPQLTMLYNDGYAQILGSKHPAALGQPFFQVWSEIESELRPLVDRVFSGMPVHMDDIAFLLDRTGQPGQLERAHFSFSYTPVRDHTGAIAGLFCPCMETTATVLAKKRADDDRDQLAQMFEQGPSFMALLSGAEHRFVLVNADYRRIAGGRDLVGRRFSEVLPEAVEQSYLRLLDQVFTSGEAYMSPQMKWSMARADGSTLIDIFVEFIYQPIKDASGQVTGIFIQGRDVTERARAEAALREINATLEQRIADRTAALAVSEAHMRAVFGSSYQMQGLLDLDGAVLDANATVLAGIDATLQDVTGKRVWDTRWFANAPDESRVIRHAVKAAAAGRATRFEVRLNLPAPRLTDFSVRPVLDASGSVTAILAEAIDITDRRLAEDALRQSQKLEAMGQLTGGVAHDFNNLLTPIIGGLDMLQRRAVGDALDQRLIGGALQSAERAQTLVQRLLAFARRQPLQAIAVDVASLVAGMADIIASTVGPQIKLVIDAAPGLPAARADENQLEMAILNLSVNARDAMPEGGSLRISAQHETLAAGHRAQLKPGDYIRLSVVDTGVGMDAETLARAIEPFFSTKGIGKGTGLGLSMVHGLATQLDGTLILSSTPGAGTDVELWLPVSGTEARLNGENAPPGSRPAAIGIALLVDDEDAVRLTTAFMLEDLGFEVIEAVSAEAALEMIAAGQHVDLLVTDHLMPGMTGVDLARAVRQHRPGVPVLLVSGFADAEGLPPELPRLTKPFRQAELAASVATLMGARA